MMSKHRVNVRAFYHLNALRTTARRKSAWHGTSNRPKISAFGEVCPLRHEDVVMQEKNQARSRQLIAGLVVAFLLYELDLLALAGLVLPPNAAYPAISWEALLNTAATGTMCSHACLPALWLAWGTRRLVLRCVVLGMSPFVFCVLLRLAEIMAGNTPQDDFTTLLFPIGCFALISFVAAAVVRLVGFRLQRFLVDDADPVPFVRRSFARPRHFSLRTMFAWMTVSALVSMFIRVAQQWP